MNKHRLNKKDGIAPVASGNWGCGQSSQGNVQLKLVIQWMAASLAGLPVLIYNTCGHEKLAKVNKRAKKRKFKHTITANFFFKSFYVFPLVGHRVSCFVRSQMDSWTVGCCDSRPCQRHFGI